MAKIEIDPIIGDYSSATAVNLRFQQIEDTLNDNVLWRDGFTGEVNAMNKHLDMNGFLILNHGDTFSDEMYLGSSATPPTHTLSEEPLGAEHEGYMYFNSVSNDTWIFTGSSWGLIGTTQNSASSVTIADSGAYFTATDVEGALQEIGAGLITDAADVNIADAGGYYTGTDVEAALQEIGAGGFGALNEGGQIALTGLSDATIVIPTDTTRVRVTINTALTGATTGNLRFGIGSNSLPWSSTYSSNNQELGTAGNAGSQSTTDIRLVTGQKNTQNYTGTVELTRAADFGSVWFATAQLFSPGTNDTFIATGHITTTTNTPNVVTLGLVGTTFSSGVMRIRLD